MTEKRFEVVMNEFDEVEYITDIVGYEYMDFADFIDFANEMAKENRQLKEELNKLKKFEYGGEHIRLSINIETGELQRHIYATGQWFGDFDRVLVDNWLSKEDYQRFINRVIEVYNTEFKKELEE